MADPSEIDAAVVTKLEASSALMALFTDGVYFDVAPPEATKFVVVSLVISEDTDVMGEADAGIQTNLYLVKAVEKSPDGSDVKTGAQLIHAALQQQALTIAGYSHMSTLRQERVRYQEVDDNTDERWQHRGGRYEVMASSNG